MATSRRLTDLFRFPGFRPYATARGVFGDPKARVLRLERRGKKNHCGVCDTLVLGIYDRKVRRVRDLSCGDARIYLEFKLRRVASSSGVLETALPDSLG